MRRLTVILIALTALAALFSVASAARRPSATDRAASEALTRYLMFDGTITPGDNSDSRLYHLLQVANSLEPGNPDVEGLLGQVIILRDVVSDSASVARAYRAVRQRFYANPSDWENGLLVASFADGLGYRDDCVDIYRRLHERFPMEPQYAIQYAMYRALDAREGDSTAVPEALGVLDRIARASDSNPELAYNKLRILYNLTTDTAAMISSIRQLYATAPQNAQLNFTTGALFDYIDQPDTALNYYERACLLDSTLGEARMAIAEYYLARGDSARYDAETEEALYSPSLDFDSKYEILRRFTQQYFQQPTRADHLLRVFDRVEQINPGEAQFYFLRGGLWAYNDSLRLAQEDMHTAIDLAPENPDYYNALISIATEMGDTALAVSTAIDATRKFDNAYFPIFAASTLMSQGAYGAALAALDSFDTSGFNNPKALSQLYTARGDVLSHMNQRDSAYLAYDRAIAADPTNILALNNAAYYMAVDGINLDQAERYARRVMDADAENPTYVDTYAWVLFRQKDFSGARRQIDMALELCEQDSATAAIKGQEPEYQPSAEIYDHAGDIYFMTGDHQQALVFWEKALALDPENAKIRKKVTHKTYFPDDL